LVLGVLWYGAGSEQGIRRGLSMPQLSPPDVACREQHRSFRLCPTPHRDELVQMKVVSHGLVIES